MNPFFRSIFLSISAGALALTAVSQVQEHSLAPQNVPYTGQTPIAPVDHDRVRFQGDILLDKPVASLSSRPKPQMLTVASPQSLWPQVGGVATVYYTIDPDSDPNATPKINDAISTFNGDFPGLIQWVQWSSSNGPNYVDINLNAYDFSGECEAAEGYEAVPAQPMGGSTACAVGTILHEMGHVIGLWHEQSRPDRDSYITVNYNNAIKGSWSNFEIVTQNAQTLGLYDYASLMQYPPYSFSRNGGPVIETIPAGIPLSNVEGVPVPSTVDYSAGDKEAIERLYGAPPAKVTVTSNPVGLAVVVDGATVTTPQTYTWTLNSTHTLAVNRGIQTLTGDIENSTTSATFYYTYGRWNDSTTESHTITVRAGDGGAGFPTTSPQVSTYSANFIQLVPYTSAMYPAGSGSVAISPAPVAYSSPAGQYFVARQQATLTAKPASGWNFYEFNNGPYWLPGGLGANPKQFYVPDTGNPVNTTAEFTNTPVYTVSGAPDPFSSNLYAYVDGGFVYLPHNFSSYYDSTWTTGSSHTLSLDSPEYPYSSNSRYAFSSWNDGGPLTHTINALPAAPATYTAVLTPEFAPATNFSYPPCGGSGSLSPASPTNDGFYPAGQVLTYSATPTPGYSWNFAGWSYDLTGLTTPATLTANDETLVFANFNIASPPQILSLNSLSPDSANAGGSGFTLTLNGTGFSSDSLVSVNNSYRTLISATPESIEVPVTSADIASPGTFQVFVENYPQGQSWDGCAVFGYRTFLVHGASLATSISVSPSANPSVSGASVTFTATVASSESNATGTITFMDGSNALGTENLVGAGIATLTTTALSAGAHSITAVYSGDSNNLASTSTVLTQTVDSAATLTSPSTGATLAGPSVTFNWTSAAGATSYFLWIGSSGVGSNNLYNSAAKTVTSYTFSAMPTNGETIYVRLITNFSGAWVDADYTFTAASQAALTAPTAASVFYGPSVPFTWSAAAGANGYFLEIGSTGVGSNNIYNSAGKTGTSYTFTSMPTNGETIYVRLITNYSGSWVNADYTFTAAAQASLTSLAAGSVLPGPSVPFAWSPAIGATGYFLSIGSTGVGSNNIYNSAEKTVTSYTFNSMPTNGETIYVRLTTNYSGNWVHADYTYVAATQAAMTSPTAGSVLPGPSVPFAWSAAAGATGYYLQIGSTGIGSSNLYNSAQKTVTSYTFAATPTNGETIYVRLITNYSGAWVHADYTYTAATQAAMISPDAGSTFTGASVPFSWSAATGANGYFLQIGSTGVGSDNIYNSAEKTVTSYTFNGMPTNGETIYIRLITNYNGSWVHADYTYTAE